MTADGSDPGAPRTRSSSAPRSRPTRHSLVDFVGAGLKAALVLIALAVPASARPCSCLGGDEPVDQLLKSSAAVFWGRVVAIEPDTDPLPGESGTSRIRDRVRFDVGAAWKGVTAADTWVREASQPTACGFPFTEGEIYLVFASGDLDGELVVWQCSGTRPWPTRGTLEELDHASPPRRFEGHPRSEKKGDGA